MKTPASDISRILQGVLENEKELMAFGRATRWGDGPITFVGSPASYPACLTAAAAFETDLGIPVTARVEADFLAYSLEAVRPRALVFAVPPFDSGEGMLAAARTLRAKGARLLTLGGEPQNPLVSAADGVVPFVPLPEPSSSSLVPLARHATLAYLALVSGQILKPPSEERRREEAEFRKLPEDAERAVVQWSEALAAFGEEVKNARRLFIAGGGRFFPVGLEIAWLRGRTTGVALVVQDVSLAGSLRLQSDERGIVLSSSRCRVHAHVDRWAAQVRNSGGVVLAVTDAADKNLLDVARFSLLLPTRGEAAAAILQLAVAEAWVSALPSAKGSAKSSGTLERFALPEA